MFTSPEPIKYDNPVDIYRFGIPKTEEEELFESLVQVNDAIEKCTIKACSRDLWENTPLCKDHAYDLWLKVETSSGLDDSSMKYERETRAAKARKSKQVDAIKEHQEALKEEWVRQAEEEERRRRIMNRPGTIYYLQVGALIKIGFSAYLDERLRSYPPDAKLLAQHPGTPETEQRVHNKFFNDLTHGREWFTPSEAITQHIQHVYEQFPTHNENLIQ